MIVLHSEVELMKCMTTLTNILTDQWYARISQVVPELKLYLDNERLTKEFWGSINGNHQ